MDTTNKYVNIEVGGFPFLASEINPSEAFNRYEKVDVKLMNGTCTHHQGEYVLREFDFKTTLDIPEEEPDIHYSAIKELMKEPVQIVCPEIDAFFKAMVIFKPVRTSPSLLELDVNVKEVCEN